MSVRQVPEFRDPRAGQFYERMEEGRGVYLSPEQIAERRGTRIVDLFRNVRGIRVEGLYEGIFMQATGGYCIPTYYLNGYRRRLIGNRLNDLIDRERLWAIEVYSRPWDAPPGFPPDARHAHCGVVMIWTRDA